MSDKGESAEHKTRRKTVGIRLTPLSPLRRNKNTLQSPTKLLKNISFASWVNDGLCDVLWAALLHRAVGRESALAGYRLLVTLLKGAKGDYEHTLLTHSSLSRLSEAEFDFLLAEFIAAGENRTIFAPLRLVDSLPDSKHWSRHIPNCDPTTGWTALAAAVADVYDHQSQISTDIRWLKVMSAIARDRMRFSQEMRDYYENIIGYPGRGDQRSVRPSIRAGEISIRAMEDGKGRGGAAWSGHFWAECWDKTLCEPVNPDENATCRDTGALFERIANIYDQVSEHFVVTMQGTSVDPRHDGTFGIVLYVLQLLLFSLNTSIGQALSSRLVLRTCVECYITLSFLQVKDDPTIWLQYRNHGSGQARLSLLKLVESTESPSFLTKDLAESLASEDMWHEYLDIKLGSWSEKNLRTMSEEAGVKQFYDRYYDAASGYIHGSWHSVRHAVYGICLNPLHRFHRFPLPPRVFVHDAIPDLIKVANLSLDRLATLYPPFKYRLRITQQPGT